ncbi:hypothetical protein, partial [Nostoc sp.]|uniref:hypothetical protein n=1 Tax=Nostoc sp. TaxID=1180 RepID=UPI002FFA84E2
MQRLGLKRRENSHWGLPVSPFGIYQYRLENPFDIYSLASLLSMSLMKQRLSLAVALVRVL